MKNYPFDYNIYPDNSPKLFKETCSKIEKNISELAKKELLVDVDGTTIQKYEIGGGEIVVFDDYDIGAVFVQSDIDLSDALA